MREFSVEKLRDWTKTFWRYAPNKPFYTDIFYRKVSKEASDWLGSLPNEKRRFQLMKSFYGSKVFFLEKTVLSLFAKDVKLPEHVIPGANYLLWRVVDSGDNHVTLSWPNSKTNNEDKQINEKTATEGITFLAFDRNERSIVHGNCVNSLKQEGNSVFGKLMISFHNLYARALIHSMVSEIERDAKDRSSKDD